MGQPNSSASANSAYPGIQSSKAARFTLLGSVGGAFDVLVNELAGRDMRLDVPQAVDLDAPVRVDWGDRMLLGEVRGCEPGTDGYALRIEVSQMLSSMTDLSRLMTALLGDREAYAGRTGSGRIEERRNPASERLPAGVKG